MHKLLRQSQSGTNLESARRIKPFFVITMISQLPFFECLSHCKVLPFFKRALFAGFLALSTTATALELSTPEAQCAHSFSSQPSDVTIVQKYLESQHAVQEGLALQIARSAVKESSGAGVPLAMTLAIIQKESRFRPLAKNPSGATGLMQVMPRYHRDKLRAEGPAASLLTPETNIRVGLKVLTEYLAQANGNIEAALRKYSGGAKAYVKEVQSLQRHLTKYKEQVRQGWYQLTANRGDAPFLTAIQGGASKGTSCEESGREC